MMWVLGVVALYLVWRGCESLVSSMLVVGHGEEAESGGCDLCSLSGSGIGVQADLPWTSVLLLYPSREVWRVVEIQIQTVEHVQRPHLLTPTSVCASLEGTAWQLGGSTRWPQARESVTRREARNQIVSIFEWVRRNLGVPTWTSNNKSVKWYERKEKLDLRRSEAESS